jgi:tetraacyldisaccharide 4'-kinase
MMRRLLLPLTPLYATAVAAKNAVYDRKVTKPQRLKWPVISVGNISVGGSGKTPFVICLAELLKRHGVLVDVLSRGYGRNSGAVERVDPAGDAERFGDEPLLIAQSADVPVYVGSSRYASGYLAEREQAVTGIHLLDDGFQHRKLARSVDIVLMHRSDFQETLLPSGQLREPISSVKRASVVVLREEDGDLEQKLKQPGIEKTIWWIRRSIAVPDNAGKVVAFCGIARSDEFFQMLAQHHVQTVATRAFRDHHRYVEEDIRQLIQEAQTHSANTFVTTEKDFVRLLPRQKEMIAFVAALQVAKLETRLCDEAAALRHLETLLPAVFKHSL